MLRFAFFFTILLVITAPLPAQNWPSFRGPGATGVLDTAGIPVSWDVETKRNIAWRTPIAGLAHSSPIVWGNRIFVTTAVSSDPKSVFQYPLAGQRDRRTDVSKHQYKIYCLEKGTGKVLWERVAAEGQPHGHDGADPWNADRPRSEPSFWYYGKQVALYQSR
jgi:hypothetical protein